MRIMLPLVSAAVLLSTAAAAADNATAAKKDDSQKIVCRTEEFVGSMIPKRTCMTKENWEKRRQAEKDFLDPDPFGRDRRGPAQGVQPGG